jgi:hypothetical protein
MLVTVIAIHENEERAWLTTDYGLCNDPVCMRLSEVFQQEFWLADKWSSAANSHMPGGGVASKGKAASNQT